LGLEIIIPTSSKNKNALSLNTIIHITLANHFAINILSHTLFNFLYHLSIIGERKKKIIIIIIIKEEQIRQLNQNKSKEFHKSEIQQHCKRYRLSEFK
jgi:hypothetical protein